MNKLSTLPVLDNAADIVTVSGIDHAKNLFAIHGTNAAGKNDANDAAATLDVCRRRNR